MWSKTRKTVSNGAFDMKEREKKLAAFERLLNIMDELREKCPWDRKQTFDSLRCNTIEEVMELAEAVEDKDMREIKEELGDVMLHLAFYSKMAEETGDFDIGDVCNGICEKMIGRHPHIYGEAKAKTAEDVLNNWEKIKEKERKGEKRVLDGVPKGLPSLIKASRIQEKASRVGFDWEKREDVWEKVREEIGEVEQEMKNGQDADIEGEFGDLLFSIVNAMRLWGVNPDNALERTNRKFIGRFNQIEEGAKAQGKRVSELSLDEMEELWQKAKNVKY